MIGGVAIFGGSGTLGQGQLLGAMLLVTMTGAALWAYRTSGSEPSSAC